tara:strand:+ start:903 stop:1781 length:879 start_codon:yes stop_codon:yes gene_type:complete
MINIFFVPGMFGTTLEYILRNYTVEFDSVQGSVLEDGSMHTFAKEFHPCALQDLEQFRSDIKISTPIYPFPSEDLAEIIKLWPGDLNTSKNIFVHAVSIDYAEMNMLFQYYKIAKGKLNLGLEIFCSNNKDNILNWNNAHTHWSQMHPWELREWISLFYPVWLQKWIDIDSSIATVPNKLTVSNTDILSDIEAQFVKIAEFCNLTVSGSYKEFFIEWTNKQQYIIDEFELIDKIINCTLSEDSFEWDSEDICFLSEAIIQRKLRDNGYELKCFDLNTFPNSSKALYNILEKV